MSRELFSPEQLVKLTLHTTAINAILVEALLTSQEQDTPDVEPEIDVEIHVAKKGKEPETIRTTEEKK
jgi:hypothetical protein